MELPPIFTSVFSESTLSSLVELQHMFGSRGTQAALHSDDSCFPASVAMGRAAVCIAGVPVSAALEQRSVGSSQHHLRPSMSPLPSATCLQASGSDSYEQKSVVEG